ncbi:MAG TPA: prolipoprotein diacylglyceryl transferase [Thermopetrobacter sp.]|nr:prolipoprotein diacylglyceryl transferase [Thermopetrobacter sp.]
MPPLFAIPFPAIDPVAVSIGPLQVRWYALAYIFGLLLAVAWARHLLRREELWRPGRPLLEPAAMDDFMVWAMLGVVIGGRLGYVLFYNPGYYFRFPAQILAVWHGGMSFHGGFAGFVVAAWLFVRRRGVPLLRLLDLAAAGTPLALLLGRIANFVNGELWGRPTDVPWAMIFPGAGPQPRHPSQLYEAGLEGVALFMLLWWLIAGRRALARPGLVGGAFCAGYATARIAVEFFREPDAQIGYLAGGWLTMGMVLSLPLLALGLWLMARAWRRPATAGEG